MAEKVNDYMNRTKYIQDNTNWGKSDYWATPVEFFDAWRGLRRFCDRQVFCPARAWRPKTACALRSFRICRKTSRTRSWSSIPKQARWFWTTRLKPQQKQSAYHIIALFSRSTAKHGGYTQAPIRQSSPQRSNSNANVTPKIIATHNGILIPAPIIKPLNTLAPESFRIKIQP